MDRDSTDPHGCLSHRRERQQDAVFSALNLFSTGLGDSLVYPVRVLENLGEDALKSRRVAVVFMAK